MPRYITICLLALIAAPLADAQTKRPNVVLVMTDDQGHGDLGFHGNPKIRTPNLDKFARGSTRLKYFYVSPVCSPTRASLMTGRYNYRTGVVDTYLGRSMMHGDEVTLAEMLAAAGYRTGIFGKWHLGDNYPLRAMDQGFHESLVHNGGGIGQPSDPPGNTYFDPILQHNGKAVKKKGYCSDIFTDGAIEFITKNKKQPFFVYLSFNAPHTPLQVPDKYYLPYKKMNLAHDQFPKIGQPLTGKANQDATARVYGMVENIDDNFGRLLAKLDELNLTDNTIVIFLTDNGPQQSRYNSGLRGRKGSVYEGGVRVPCFIRWPGSLPKDDDVDRIAAHIDIAPTLLNLCNAKKPAKVNFDGRDLTPLLKGTSKNWPDRTLFFQWHRGDEPVLYRHFAARSQKYRLVQPSHGKKKIFELYDMSVDRYEQNNIAAKHPKIVANMKKEYEEWFKDVSSTRGYAPPRIYIGSKHENPVILTRQDWRGPKATWGKSGVGHWEVKVIDKGRYDVTLRFVHGVKKGTVYFKLGGAKVTRSVKEATQEITLPNVELQKGDSRCEPWVTTPNGRVGAAYVEIEKR